MKNWLKWSVWRENRNNNYPGHRQFVKERIFSLSSIKIRFIHEARRLAPASRSGEIHTKTMQ